MTILIIVIYHYNAYCYHFYYYVQIIFTFVTIIIINKYFKGPWPSAALYPHQQGRYALLGLIWGFPKIRGTIWRGPHNKDYGLLVSILGSACFGKLPHLG